MTSIYQQQIIDHYKYPRNFVKLDNPTIEYGDKNPVVYAGRNGSKDFNGRMRFDETECSSGSSKKQIALWIKTHKDEDYKPTLISMDGWCN